MSDHIVSYWTQFRRDKKGGNQSLKNLKILNNFFVQTTNAGPFLTTILEHIKKCGHLVGLPKIDL